MMIGDALRMKPWIALLSNCARRQRQFHRHWAQEGRKSIRSVCTCLRRSRLAEDESGGRMNTTTIGEIVRGDREVFPPYLYEAYQSTRRRAPMLPLIEVPLTLSELTGPGPVISAITPEDADLTRNAGTGGEAIGQRIIVTGRVLDDRGSPVPNTLLEIWQANAAGRYLHKRDQWPGPLDPNFLGMGRCLTNEEGVYRFLTIRPGAYPW